MDGFLVDFKFDAFYPMHHGIKCTDDKDCYNKYPFDFVKDGDEVMSCSRGAKAQYLSIDLLYKKVTHQESWIFGAHGTSDQTKVPRWDIRECLTTLSCRPYENDEKVVELPYIGNADGIEQMPMGFQNGLPVKYRRR